MGCPYSFEFRRNELQGLRTRLQQQPRSEVCVGDDEVVDSFLSLVDPQQRSILNGFVFVCISLCNSI